MTTEDPIGNAQPSQGNPHMRLLFAIWTEFIEPLPDADLGCSLCLRRILRNFKELKQTLEQLEEESQILKALNERAKGRGQAAD